MLMSVDLLHIYEEAGPNIILRTILTAALLAARNHEMSSFWLCSRSQMGHMGHFMKSCNMLLFLQILCYNLERLSH